MANMKLIIALFASLFFVGAMAFSHQETVDALERRAEALEMRAEQLQDLAAVYRRALTSVDDISELVERGQGGSRPKKPTVNLHCDGSIPWSVCSKAKEKVQKMYGKDKNLHKFENGDIFIPYPIGGRQEVIRHVSVAFYNGNRRPVSAPTINVSLGI